MTPQLHDLLELDSTRNAQPNAVPRVPVAESSDFPRMRQHPTVFAWRADAAESAALGRQGQGRSR